MQNYALCKAYFYMAVSKIAAGIRRDGRAATDLQTLNAGVDQNGSYTRVRGPQLDFRAHYPSAATAE
jgi:hypothetical protein